MPLTHVINANESYSKDSIATRYNLAVYILLFATMWFSYYTCLWHDFVQWDDFTYVVNNSAAHGFTIENVTAAFSKIFASNYAPVHIMSYMLDYELWGLSPRGYVLTNILIHYCNGIVFFHICNELIKSRFGALVAAFIFLFHPVQVESVAWISERKNVLSMLFFLISFYSFIQYRLTRQKRRIVLVISIAVYSLALLTKIAAVILPLVLLFFDAHFCPAPNGTLRSRFREYAPYVIISILLVATAIITQKQDHAGVFAGSYAGSVYKTFFTMLTVLPQYLLNIFWPQFLSIIYSPPIKAGFDREVILSAVAIILLIVEGVMLYRRQSQLLFWYGLFFMAFLPVSQIIPLVTVMQDRYCYFPLLGLSGFIGVMAGNCSFKVAGSNVKILIVFPLIIGIAALPVLSKSRSHIWVNSVVLFEETAKAGIGNRYSTANTFVEYKLANAYFAKAEELANAGHTDRALDYCLKSLAVDPLHYDALVKIGALLLGQERYAAAHHYLAKLTDNYPKSHVGLYNLGQFYFRMDNMQQAQEYYQKALHLNPAYQYPKLGLAAIAVKRGDYRSALTLYREIVATGHESADNYYVLAGLEAVTGDTEASYRYLETAVNLGFNDIRALKNNPIFARVINKPQFQKLMTLISEEN
jgi:tetratricopeptide (TPR) repeat protein